MYRKNAFRFFIPPGFLRHTSERRHSPAHKEGTMVRHICIFEDSQHIQFLPLVYFRPVYDLRCGIFQLKEKILLRAPKTGITLQCRLYLAGSVQRDNPGMFVNEIPSDECLFINGRIIASQKLFKKIFSAAPKGYCLYTRLSSCRRICAWRELEKIACKALCAAFFF